MPFKINCIQFQIVQTQSKLFSRILNGFKNFKNKRILSKSLSEEIIIDI